MTTIRQLLREKGHKIYSIGPDSTVYEAIRTMADENIGSLVVMQGGKIVGIITERDYARNVELKGRDKDPTFDAGFAAAGVGRNPTATRLSQRSGHRHQSRYR